MIKKFLSTITLLILQIFFPQEFYAQSLAPDFIWAKNFGGTGFDGSTDVTVDNSGNIIATGYFDSTMAFGSFQLTSFGGADIFIVKYNSDGDVIWARSAGGSEFDRGYSVTTDDFDNIIVTGTFSGLALFSPFEVQTNGNSDVFVAKYSTDGSVIWVVNYGAGGYEYGFDVTTDNLNNILVTGTSQNFGSVALPFLIFVLKYNPQGIQQWANTAGGLNGNNSGYGVAANSNNDVFVVGCFADSVNFSGTILNADPGGDVFLAKYSANGIFNWVRQAGFNNNNDQAGGIVIDENDDLYITGHFRDVALFGNFTLTPVGSTDIFIAKYDQLGNPIWVKQDSLLTDSYGTGVSLDAAGNISVIGSSIAQTENNSILIERFSKDGELLWNKLIATSPSYGFPGGITNDSNGDIIVSGSYYSTITQTLDILVGKLPSPVLLPSLNPFDFGIVEVGGSLSNTLSFSNTSSANLFLFNAVLAGANPEDFSMLNSFPQIISPQQSINIDIEFSPSSAGLRNAFLIIESDAPTSPDTVFLTGTGESSSITLSTDTLNFGNVEIPDSSDLNLTVSNLSSFDIIINNLQITNSEFKLINPSVPDTIHSSENRLLTIRFIPNTPGLKAGYLVISSSSVSSPDTVYLTGIGNASSLTLSSDTLNFGTIDVNNFSDLTLTITNENSFDITVSDAFISGIDQSEFSLINPPQFPATIPSGGFLNFSVRFSPAASGFKFSSLVIVSNSTSSPDSVILIGNGIESIIVDLPDSTLIGQSTTININSPGAAFPSNQFFYRRTGESTYQQSQLDSSGNNYIANIPPEFSTIRGIQFYIVFSGTSGSISYPTNNPVNNPASIQVQIPVLNFSGNLVQNKYQMISIPLSLSDPQLSSVLEDDYGIYDNKLWRLFRWDPSANNYLEYDNINDNFQPGNSFWLINRDGEAFDIENALSVSSNNSYTITLVPGWNQIANPFAFLVEWDSIENSNLLLQSPVRWNLDEQDYQLNQIVLNPWEGYWVFNQTVGIINLNVPPVESQLGTFEKNVLKNFSGNSFIVQIKSKLELTDIQDYQNYVGMESNALSSYDKFDILKPPPISDDLRLSILSDNKEYAQNIISLSSEGAYWDLRITSRYQNKNVNLLFEEKISLPENFKIWLLDKEGKFAVPLINGRAIINMRDQNERLLRLIIGSADYANRVSEDISLLPAEYVLFQNFPNPFNPETNIYFMLKENSTVTLEIFDILGRKIKSLVKEEVLNAGLQNVKWDGTNYSGNLAASGIYIYQLKANNFVDSKKMVLLR